MNSKIILLSLCLACLYTMNTKNLDAQVNVQIYNTPTQRSIISPLIYGLNPYHYHASITGMDIHDTGLNITSLRFGGDAVSTYNWEINSNVSWNNTCGMSYYTNDNNKYLAYASGQPVSGYGNKAGAMLKTVADANAMGAYPLIQIPAMQFVAADNDGCITTTQCANPTASTRFKTVQIDKPSALSLTPNITDATVYADECVNYLVNSTGGSSSIAGIKGYCLENEAGIWHETHKCAHPERPTCFEVLDKNIRLAKKIKTLDPSAETFGPGSYGFTEYAQLNYSATSPYPSDWSTYNMSDLPSYNPSSYNYMTWLASYLRRMKMASDEYGVRLLDVLDVHFYNQGNNLLQDSRSFWDSTYVEDSWITTSVIGGQPYNAVKYFNKAINDFYPNTKLGITEWGNFNNTNLADVGIYTADILGSMGRNKVYLANYFGILKGFSAGAFKIFRNYNGMGGKYGNNSLASVSNDNSKVTVYASIHNNDEDYLHVILINRSNSSQLTNIIINNDSISYESALVYSMKNTNGGSITQDPDIDFIEENNVSYTLLPKSIYHFVFRKSVGLGIASNDNTEDEIIISPNPTSNKFIIKGLKNIATISDINISNMQGKLYKPDRITRITNDLDEVIMPKIPNGMYIIKIQTGNTSIVRKLLIIE